MRLGGETERDFMKPENVNEATGVRTAQAQPGSPAPIAKGMGQSDRCRFCGEFYEKAKPWICPECWEGVKAAVLEYRKELL
jgi:hypothetical protein